MALGARFALIRRIRGGFSAPFWPGCSPNPKRRATSLSGRLPRDDPKARPGGVATHPPLAIRAVVASRGHAAPAAHLPGEHLPGDAAFEDEDDAAEGAPVSSTRGLPPLGLGGSGGKSGSMISQSSSLTNSLAMFRTYPYAPVLKGSLSPVSKPLA